MFEDQNPTPMTPPAPRPYSPPPSNLPPASPPLTNLPPLTSTPPPGPTPAAPSVHSMPDRFRLTGRGPGGASTTKKLLIVLIVVVVVAGLGIGGLWVFQNVLSKNDNTNNANANLNTNTTILNENVNEAVANEAVNENANLNTNLNVNVNLNSNGNLNSNLNTNTATNLNQNTNLNTNTSLITSPLPSSLDADSDGLTDVEEAAYTTDPNKPDTDGDSFIDGKEARTDGSIVGELYMGYNPKGAGKLEGSSLVTRQENETKEYSILVPATWTVSKDATGGVLITPTLPTGEFFQVRVNDNSTQMTPSQWYQSANPASLVASLTTKAINGLEGILSEDYSTIYLFKGTKVYSIQYSTGALSQVNYRTTFDMIMLSFKLGAA